MTTHHEGGGGVEVREAGRALKVQSEVPHLVSLGGGRLSTAVTLHPLPEGRMTLGSGQSVDILVQGTGVEPNHCSIDNTSSIVTLFPIAEMTSVDGVRVMTPTRLTQGSMVCIGRSNYMRFNHPAEARVMRSILPNTRISMVPLNFYTGVENVDGMDRKPPMVPRRSPRDSWGEVSNSSSCNSGSDDTCALTGSRLNNQTKVLSPKVFPMGSATVNSPASAVLGSYSNNQTPLRSVQNQSNGDILRNIESTYETVNSQKVSVLQSPIPNGIVLRNGLPNNGSAFCQTSNTFSTNATTKARCVTPTFGAPHNLTNGSGSRSQTPTMIASQTFTNSKCAGMPIDPRSITPSPAFEDSRTLAERRLGSMSSLPGINTSSMPSPTLSKEMHEYRVLTTPSPAFNRNPSPSARSNIYTSRSLTPTPPSTVVHRRTVSSGSQDGNEPIRRVSSPTPSYGSNCSQEEMTARKEELEHKRKQAQTERLREQETEKNERARLEEILSMCADYERQVQLEKQCKSPGIPQNRIKTNGSLPRDKRLPSPGISTTDDELTDVFTFDQTCAPASLTVPPSSASPLPARVLSNGVGTSRSPYENVMLTAGGVVYPQSPRTRIRTIASKETTPIRDNSDAIENRLASLANDYEFIHSLPRHTSNKSPAPQQPTHINNKPSTSQQSVPTNTTGSTSQLTNSNSPYINISPVTNPQPNNTPQYNQMTSNGIGTTPNRNSFEREKLILPLDMNPVDRLSEALFAMKTQNAQRNSERRRSLELRSGTEKQDKEARLAADKAGVEDNADEVERQRHITIMKTEYEALRKERAKLLAAMSGLKRNVTDIEQQEEEMLRELEMERALLDGEFAAQSEKLGQDQARQAELRRQLARLDQDVAHFSAREIQRQAECKTRLEAAEDKLHKSEAELGSCGDDAEKQKQLTDRVKAQRELLEQERKLFEDLEFRHLEEEANCLAGHEELQRELSDVTQRLETRQSRLAELESQRLEADHSAQLESQGLERQLINNLRKLEEVRNKLRTIEAKLDELSSQGLFSSQDSSPDASSDNDDTVRPCSTQSPEDIARISRVTKGAPLEITTGSLGRKTLESLQTIERNRQLHLAQQGSQVIENERKRVQELKQRVQDEVRAQWAEQRQRDNNCYSLNSVGSDEASSDVPTESASSDDMVDKRSSAQTTDDKLEEHDLDSSPRLHDLMREKELELERSREDRRPLTDGSDYEQQLSVSMRDRDKAARLQHQRPLTRYLPIRSERLDLRQHIETAGHQVDLCQHVTLDTTSCRGNLHKLGSKFHHWGKRWFVFDRNQRTFTYYGDRTEKKARGGAYFQAIEEVYVDHLNSVKSPSPQLTFVVKTSERTYHLMAPSAEAMRIWVDVVFTGAEGYQEFEHGS